MEETSASYGVEELVALVVPELPEADAVEPVAPEEEELPAPYAALRMPIRLLTELLLDEEESEELAFVPRLAFGPSKAVTRLN
jgi:hypothetical protein